MSIIMQPVARHPGCGEFLCGAGFCGLSPASFIMKSNLSKSSKSMALFLSGLAASASLGVAVFFGRHAHCFGEKP